VVRVEQGGDGPAEAGGPAVIVTAAALSAGGGPSA